MFKTTFMSFQYCINCFIKKSYLKFFYLSESEKVDKLIRRWTTVIGDIPKESAAVCNKCWLIAIANEDVPNAEKQLGHTTVCVWCLKSCFRKRRADVWKLNNTFEIQVREIITKEVHPRPFNQDSIICRNCYSRAHRTATKQLSCPKDSNTKAIKREHSVDEDADKDADKESFSEKKPAKQQNEFIRLSEYIRAPEVRNKCFVEACTIKEVEPPPLNMRQWLLKQCNFYIPVTCLVCSHHKNNWDFMAQTMEEIHVFKPEHVAGLLKLLAKF